MQQEFETVAEACAALKVSRSKLYNLITTGDLKAVKVGRATRILVADRVAFHALEADYAQLRDPRARRRLTVIANRVRSETTIYVD